MLKKQIRKTNLYFYKGKICCCCQFRGSGSDRLRIISQNPDPAKGVSKIVLKSLRKSENIRTIYIFKGLKILYFDLFFYLSFLN